MPTYGETHKPSVEDQLAAALKAIARLEKKVADLERKVNQVGLDASTAVARTNRYGLR